MNLAWDIVLQAAKDGWTSDRLFFQPAEDPSPYLEQSFKSINEKNVDTNLIDVNPLYRFSSIFEYLLHRDVMDLVFAEQKEFILFYFDLIMHILTEIDLCHGMTTREFCIRKLRSEMLEGNFGEVAREGMEQLSRENQLNVADELVQVFLAGSSLHAFCSIMKQIFPGCLIYQDRKHTQRIYAYIGRERDESLQKVWQMIRETFLPLDLSVKEFWGEHFGILDVDATMKIDAIAIF